MPSPPTFRALLALLASSSLALAVEPPVRIMPLGDSLTYGEELIPAIEGGYRNKLYTLLDGAGVNLDFVGTFYDLNNLGLPDVDYQGQSGAKINDIRGNLPGWLNAIEDPDIILLLIGTNDIWGNEAAGIKNRLISLVNEIAILRPHARIILSNLPRLTDNPFYLAQGEAHNDTLPEVVADLADQGIPVSLIDMHAVLTPTDFSSDAVHPSVGGYEKMADTWFPAIIEVLDQPPVIERVTPADDLTHLTVDFSKPVADDSVNLANFSVSGGLVISNAVLDATTKRSITLTTSLQTPGLAYELSVSNVGDRRPIQKTIAPESMVIFHPNAITNGSFENSYTGWSHSGNQTIPNNVPPGVATDGVTLVLLNDSGNAPNAVLSQTFPTLIGQTYQLSFDLGTFGSTTSEMALEVSVDGSTNRLLETAALNGIGGGQVNWEPRSYVFIADSNSTTLTFTDVSTVQNSTNLDLLLDNVRLSGVAHRTLAVTSSPVSGAAVTVSATDNFGNDDGTTGLIRSYDQGTTVTVTAPPTLSGQSFLKWRRNGVDFSTNNGITVDVKFDISLDAVYAGAPSILAENDSYQEDEDIPLIIPASGVLDNDTGGPPLTAVLDDLPQNGNLTLNPDGGFTYTPDPHFNGVDSFTYRASNGSVDSNPATAVITIAPVNDQPQFASASINGSDATEDSPYAATLAGSASDVDAGDTLTYSKISGPAWLIVSGNGSLSGTPLNSDVGTNVFTVRATDSAGAFDQATLNLTVNPVEKFGVWMAGYGLNAGATDDSDDDSIPNAIEFVIGGNPASQQDNNFLPTISLVSGDPDNNNSDEDYLLFTYRRTDLAASDEFTEISVEWALDPAGPWTDSVGTPGTVVVTEDDAADTGIDLVKVYISPALAVENRLFTRLKAVVAAP